MVKRGEVYYVMLPKISDSSCEYGRRPVVVISSNVGNKTSNVALVCPLTTRIKNLSCNVNVRVKNKNTQVLCNQISTIAISDLNKCIYTLNEHELKKIDRGLLLVLGVI